jgi:hypothetical protein
MRATATLNPLSPRAPVWLTVFGGLTAPLDSPVACDGLKDDGTPARFYRVNVQALTTEQRRAAARALAIRKAITDDDAHEDITGARGLLILDEDLTITTGIRGYL